MSMQMMAIIAKSMPTEMLIDKLTMDLDDYKEKILLKNEKDIEEAYSSLIMSCMLISMQDSLKDTSFGDLEKKMSQIEDAKAIMAGMDGGIQSKDSKQK